MDDHDALALLMICSSQFVVQKAREIESEDYADGPVWGSRKPRRQSLRASPIDQRAQAELDEEEADKLGVEALMSLAAAPHRTDDGTSHYYLCLPVLLCLCCRLFMEPKALPCDDE